MANRSKALRALNLDLFHPVIDRPAPATLYTKIEEARHRLSAFEGPNSGVSSSAANEPLPPVTELYERFERFNWLYFEGRLPKVRIEYSDRMTCAGSYTPGEKTIRIGRRYHELFPRDIDDTLKHEMIHILHYRHDAGFRQEAARIGASLRAQFHEALERPSKYLYVCPTCGTEYPRRKRLRMASCGQCSSGRRFDSRHKLVLKASVRKSTELQ